MSTRELVGGIKSGKAPSKRTEHVLRPWLEDSGGRESMRWSGWVEIRQEGRERWNKLLERQEGLGHAWCAGVINGLVLIFSSVQFSSVQLLSHVRLFATPWTTARQASLSITNSQSPPKLMSFESVMPSNHLILCCPLLLLPSIFQALVSSQMSHLFV